MLSDDEDALTTKFLEGGLGRSQRRFSDEDRRFLLNDQVDRALKSQVGL